MAPAVENLPANAENAREVSLTPGMGDPPEEGEMATYSSILAWRIPWVEELGGLQSMNSQGIRHD